MQDLILATQVGDGPTINPLVSKISFYLKDSFGRFREYTYNAFPRRAIPVCAD